MQFVMKKFAELTTTELYELLKARSEIFVVEQTCIYQDLDGRDYQSRHLFCRNDDGAVTAYLRMFPKPDEEGCWQMGRVLTIRHGEGLGGQLLAEGIRRAKEELKAKALFLEAQSYAIGFYQKEGFIVCSDEFLEDGIPHVAMRLTF